MKANEFSIEREIRIAARPETVFAFFTDPDKMKRWKGMSATLDPQPGGIFRIDINGQDVARGQYLEVVPYNRLVVTWGWEGQEQLPPGSSTVEISLASEGDETILRLRHLGLPAEAGNEQAKGWDHYLPRLIMAAEGQDRG